MRLVSSATLLLGLNVLATSPAMACRSGPEPAELREAEADAIILVRINGVQRVGPAPDSWEATASRQAAIFGSAGLGQFKVVSAGSASCEPGMPKVGEDWVLYLKKANDGFLVQEKWPFWWARASGDPRLRHLSNLMPLGSARKPTAEEEALLKLVEARVRLPNGTKNISNYTRVYSRDSAGIFTAKLLRSRTPQLLIADAHEMGPTRESCRCKLLAMHVDLSDLWNAGKLPPFKP